MFYLSNGFIMKKIIVASTLALMLSGCVALE
ncbi:lipoprotein, partial [Xenorhabdus bovienii]|nr:lipoprotein [Xenorhabdus bovienii]